MRFFSKTWETMADRFLTAVPPLAKTTPPAMVKDLIRIAYMQGAKDALKMAEDLDSTASVDAAKAALNLMHGKALREGEEADEEST